MKKFVPNPEYEKAKFAQVWIGQPGLPAIPEVRTNNPYYLSDGCKESDRIPSHIEVDE